jgi:PAS domain S-box-containing protein
MFNRFGHRLDFLSSLSDRLLLALLAVAIIPLGIVGLGGAAIARQVVEGESGRELTGLARGLAAQLDLQTQGLFDDGRAIASGPAFRFLDPEMLPPALAEARERYPHMRQLAAYNRAGQAMSFAGVGDGSPALDGGAFQQALDGAPAWSIYREPDGEPLAFITYTPIRQANTQVAGVLIAFADINQLTFIAARARAGSPDRVLVIDQGSRVLFVPGPPLADVRPGAAWSGISADSRRAGIGNSRYRIGREMHLAGFAAVPTVGWTVVYERPESAALAPAQGFWTLALIGIAVTAALSVAVAILFARTLTRPVRELALAARAFGADDSVAPLPVAAPGSAEVKTLVDAFATMRNNVLSREAALRESEERYRLLVEHFPEAIAVHSQGKLTYANQAYLRLVGARSVAELGEAPVLQFVDPAHRAIQEERMRRVAEGGGAMEMVEEQVFRSDGQVVDVEVTAIPLTYEGKPAAQVLIRDITARKESELALREAEERLRQAQKMEAVGALAGGIAHDFNNLLTAINGFSQLLLWRLPEKDRSRTFVEEILKAGERASDLTRQLLAFGRRQVLQPRVIDLNATIGEMDKLLHRVIGEDMRLRFELADELDPIKADPGQIGQVLMNLVVNARDAMPDGGDITIQTGNVDLDDSYERAHGMRRAGPHVLLMVRDSGTGMSRETQQRIFEPFFTTKGPGKGTGLGLATVYGIVKQSGGDVWVQSELGVGTEFRIFLPKSEEELTLPGAAPAPVEAIPRGEETVLLVEDELGVRGLAVAVLESSGYTVLSTEQPGQAIELCDRHEGPIHLLLTDVVMPGMNGHEVAKTVSSRRPETKILFMSGYTPDVAVRHGVLSKSAYLQKPFSPAALARKVREVLDSVPVQA